MKNLFSILLLFYCFTSFAQVPSNGGMVQKIDVRTEFKLPFYSTLPGTGKPRSMLYDYNGDDSALYIRSYDGTRWIKFASGLPANFANTDLTFTSNREHNLGDYNLRLKNTGTFSSNFDLGGAQMRYDGSGIGRFFNDEVSTFSFNRSVSNTTYGLRQSAISGLVDPFSNTKSTLILYADTIYNRRFLSVPDPTPYAPTATTNISKYKLSVMDRFTGAMVTIEPSLIANLSGWGLTGNSGTIGYDNFIGTTDNVPFTIRQNNEPVGYFYGNEIAIGRYAQSGTNTVSLGNSTGSDQFTVSVGNNANANTFGQAYTSVGHNAGLDGENSTGKVSVGYQAGMNAKQGLGSTNIGTSSGYNSSYSTFSTSIGDNSFKSSLNSTGVVSIGYMAGNNLQSSSYSTLIGYQVGSGFVNNNIGTNNIIIGTNISLPNLVSNRINIGNVLYGMNTHIDSGQGFPSIVPTSNGRIGIGVVNPNNTLEIYSANNNTSGLRLSRLTSSSPVSSGKAIGVNSTGDVVTIEGDGENVTKTSDENISLQTTVQPDDHLFYNIMADNVYKVELFLIVNVPDIVPDLRFQINTPTYDFSKFYLSTSTSTTGGFLPNSLQALNYTTTGTMIVRMEGTIKPNVSGNISLSWSQFNNSSSAISILKGSYMLIKKLI